MIERNLNYEQTLEHQFLYNDDYNSIFLLLSLLDNKNLCDNLVPKYTVVKTLLTGLRRSIRSRDDKKSIVNAISRLVSDDLNRLELAFAIKAYRSAYEDNSLIDKLEFEALKVFGPENIGNREILFQDSDNKFVEDFLLDVEEQLIKNKELQKLEKYANEFLDSFLKKKIYKVNYYMDKQIVVDYSNAGILKVEGKNLTINELKHIFDKSKFYINRSLRKAYITQYWYSLNDCVLKRYL